MSNPAFSLIVSLPGEEPVRHDLGDGPHTFGRSPENDIQVLVSEVSVRHGRIEKEGEGYRVFDNGSTNGTRLNGAPVGQEGATLAPMDQLLLGTVVPAYFVPAAVLASTSLPELVASLEAAPKAASQPETAPVAVVAPAGPGAVKLAPAAPGAVKPAPVRAAIPLGGAPATPGGASTVKLDQVRSAPPGVRPAAVPAPPRKPIAGPPAGGPKPPVAAPLRPPGAPAAGAPPAGAPPAGGPVAPKPIPLKRPDPASPTLPLPKLPPKPDQ